MGTGLMTNCGSKKVTTITESYVDNLINFQPTEAIKSAGIGPLQRSGTVALFNMLVENGVAYLADEVGMGKTYIGLAVMNLLRYQKPSARVLILTPRRNIQEKWSTDLFSFVKQNWINCDHRVKTPQGSPVWPALMPDRLSGWVNQIYDKEIGAHDTILRMSSFSLGVNEENGKIEVERFKKQLEPIGLQSKLDKLENTQSCFNQVIKEYIEPYTYDLIIVDEAHNLKHGYIPGQASSNRNQSLYDIFAKPAIDNQIKPWLLLLSATPMENGEPESLVRQFQVFGRESDLIRSLKNQNQENKISDITAIENRQQAKEIQQNLIVRRVGELRFKDQTSFTRNMYRREWRKGGVEDPVTPMQTPKTSEQLVHGVLQKNVFDMLESKSSGKFKVGSLESFEVYSGVESGLTESEDKDGAAKLADQHILALLCQSYRKTFNREVPHPKLNAVSRLLAKHIEQREKALVFVRRVATTADLATRAAQAFDTHIVDRITAIITPEDSSILDDIKLVWKHKRLERQVFHKENAISKQNGLPPFDDDSGSQSEVVPSFFTWFFRGEHKTLENLGLKDIFSGIRLRDQLNPKNRFSLILEENYVDWVLKRPEDIIGKLCEDSGKSEDAIINEICKLIPHQHYLGSDSRRRYHSVQYASLIWMRKQQCYLHLANNVAILIEEIFGEEAPTELGIDVINKEDILSMLTMQGIYPSLSRTKVKSLPWKIVARGVFEHIEENADLGFRLALRRREQIRHMQMTLLKHGAPMVDLYLSTIKSRGGVLRTEREYAEPPERVATIFTTYYKKLSNDSVSWRRSGGWELLEVKQNFELLNKLNFPTLDIVRESERPLDKVFLNGNEPANDEGRVVRSVRRLLNLELSGQAPTVVATGGQNDQRRHRITTQFRMPGMPWVIVATNVYEEGVDLHTYCKTVVHHGLSHTASSVEQRTGRVDRIGGLIQRKAESVESAAEFFDKDKIQSLFPYPNDTFEKYQVRRVLANCNRFLLSLHDTEETVEERVMTLEDKYPLLEQIVTPLKSPFVVSSDSEWLKGCAVETEKSSHFSREAFFEEFGKLESALSNIYQEKYSDSVGQGLERHYSISNFPLRISPQSHREGDHLVLIVQTGEALKYFDCSPKGDGWYKKVLKYIEKRFAQQRLEITD